MDAERQRLGIPGVAWALVHEGRVVHARGFGEAGPEAGAVTPQTPFAVGSLSKAVTALAVMREVEAGRLALDAPVQAVLPWFRVADAEASRAITLRHLLTHTSGLPTSAYAVPDGTDLETRVRRLAGVALTAPVGGAVQYSSANYQVAGLMVEVRSGMPFGRYVETQVFAPAGMRHARASLPDAASVAAGHRLWFGLPVATRPFHDAGGLPNGSLLASAEDVGRLLGVLQRQGRTESGAPLVSAQSVAALLEPRAPTDQGFAYGMGWRIGTTAGLPSAWHGGSTPSSRGAMALLTEPAYGLVVLSNLGHPTIDTTRHIARGLAAQLAGQPPPAPEGATPRQLGLGVGLAALVVLGLAVRGLVRARRGVDADLARGRRAHAVRGAVLDLAVPPVLLLVVPRLLEMPLAGAAATMPDVTLAVGLLAAVSVARGLVRLARLRTAAAAAAPREARAA